MANDILMKLLEPVKALLGIKRTRRPFDVINGPLKLFRYFSLFLLASALITSCFQLFGSPIHCHLMDEVKLDRKLFESFCWVEGVHDIVSDTQDPVLGNHAHGRPENAQSPYLIPYYPEHEETRKRKHNYYPWVSLVLMLQSLLIYLPYRLSKAIEPMIKRIALKDPYDDKHIFREMPEVAESFLRNRVHHSKVFHRVLACSLLGLLVILAQMAIADFMLDNAGRFWHFGWFLMKIATLYETPKSDAWVPNPMDMMFPRLVKCDTSYYSPNGNPIKVDGLCILPINIFNAKVYTALWFASYVIFVIIIIFFLVQTLWWLSPSYRLSIVKQNFARKLPRDSVAFVATLSMSEWVVFVKILYTLFPDEVESLITSLSQSSKRKSPSESNPETVIKQQVFYDDAVSIQI